MKLIVSRCGEPWVPAHGEGRRTSVLIADVDVEQRHFVASATRALGYEVTEASTTTELLDAFGSSLAAPGAPPFDLVFARALLSDAQALQLLTALQDVPWRRTVAFITVMEERPVGELARVGAVRSLLSPFAATSIVRLIRGVLPLRVRVEAGARVD